MTDDTLEAIMVEKMEHRILIYGGLGDLACHHIIPALNMLSKEFPLEFAIVDIVPNSSRKYYQFGKEPLNEYNAAIISTPNDTHSHIAKKALNSGMHILCEKPISHTLEAAEEILKAAKKYSAQVSMLSDHYLYKPAIREVIRNWERYENQIGKLEGIEAKVLESSGVEGREWLLEKSRSGGGVAMDTGTHLVSIMGRLFGYEKINVRKAFITRYKGAPGEGETYAHIMLDIGDVPVDIEVGKGMASTQKDIVFQGDKGKLEIDIQEEQVKLNGEMKVSFAEDDSYEIILREFLLAIEGKRPPWTTLEEGYKALKVIQNAYEIALS